MTPYLSDRLGVGLAISVNLLHALAAVPVAFAPSDPVWTAEFPTTALVRRGKRTENVTIRRLQDLSIVTAAGLALVAALAGFPAGAGYIAALRRSGEALTAIGGIKKRHEALAGGNRRYGKSGRDRHCSLRDEFWPGSVTQGQRIRQSPAQRRHTRTWPTFNAKPALG